MEHIFQALMIVDFYGMALICWGVSITIQCIGSFVKCLEGSQKWAKDRMRHFCEHLLKCCG